MALTVKIGDAAIEASEETPKAPPVKISLKIRKTVAGNLLISDHPDIDIVIIPKDSKVMAFPKEKISDKVYDIQDRFFKFLGLKGAIVLDTIQGGNVYGTLAARYPESQEASALETVLYVVSKFIEEESQYFNLDDELEREFEESLTDPDEQDSTELGEVPHSSQKGSIRPGYIYSPYGISSAYRYE